MRSRAGQCDRGSGAIYAQRDRSARRKKEPPGDPGGYTLNASLCSITPSVAALEDIVLAAAHSQKEDLVWADSLWPDYCSQE